MTQEPPPPSRLVRRGRDGLEAFEQAALALALGGLAMRLPSFWNGLLVDDAAWYATMAESLLRHGEFLVPGQDGAYTHHFPPAYPALLALAFLVAGPSLAAIALTNLVVAFGFVSVAFLTTRDLYGRRRAFAVAAVAACFPLLIEFDAMGLSETLVATFFALTIWGILRSLDKPRFIVVAGAAAGLGYLTKSSMGPFFLLAGGAGFAWRFAYARWAVFRDRDYALAVLVFLAFVAPWTWRNLARHGSWETQPYATHALRLLFSDGAWWSLVPLAFAVGVGTLAVFALPFLAHVRASLRLAREERTSALWMAVVTPTLVAAFFVAAFSFTEGIDFVQNTLVSRYVVAPLVPLLWLGMRGLDLAPRLPEGARDASGRAPTLARRHARLAAAGVLAIALGVALDPTYQIASTGRALVVLGATVVGVALLFAARASWWAAVARDAAGERSWRIAPAAADGRGALVGLGVLAVGWAAAFAFSAAYLPFFLAAGAAALVPDTRGKVLAVAIVLLSASLSGAYARYPSEDLARDAAALVGADGTVAFLGDRPAFVWPFLPDEVRLVDAAESPDAIIELPARSSEASPPPGYTVASRHDIDIIYAPGSRLSLLIEQTLDPDAPMPPSRPAAFVYARAST